ncbi:MAG: thioredoxin fold domain-containing protein [Pseudomonadota bacterium]
MNKMIKKYTLIFSYSLLLLSFNSSIYAQVAKEHKSYPWFKQSFLDLAEDISDAKDKNKGLILYFHQQGCPYCKKLLNDNFSRSELVKKLRRQYDFIAINMWGDSNVVDLDGEQLTEKTLAVKLKVMFTPTLLFFNNKAELEFRLNGYYSPEKFHLLLDYLALKNSSSTLQQSFSQYYKTKLKAQKQGLLVTKNYISSVKNYSDLVNQSALPVMVLFEENNCSECDELHQIIGTKTQIKDLLKRFTLSRGAIHSKQPIIDINGKKTSYSQWADKLNIQYTPTLVFFIKDEKTAQPKEIFRVDSYLKAFHLESVLLYIADKHYIQFPEFQRYIHQRVDEMEKKGIKIELWD